MITQKMAGQQRSEIQVGFTMILSKATFGIW